MKGRFVDSTHDDEGLVRRCVLEFARPHNWGKPAVFVAVLLLAGAARAQSIAPSATTPNAAAEQLFAEGRALLDAGQYAAACPKLAESQRLDPTAGTLLNLANCYEKNGQTASAWGTFKEASRSAIDRHRPDWERIATKRATALEPKLSRLTVAVPLGARVAGLTITAGALAVEPPMFDTAIPLDPGRIFVTARAPLHKTWTGTIDLGTNADRRTIAIPLLEWEPVAGPTVMPALRPNPPLSRREVRSIPAASWILGATALAAA